MVFYGQSTVTVISGRQDNSDANFVTIISKYTSETTILPLIPALRIQLPLELLLLIKKIIES